MGVGGDASIVGGVPAQPATTGSYFIVYAITYDEECFGLYATIEEAEDALARQLADGGPAWEDCHVNPWRIKGEPEIHVESAA